MEEFRVRLRKAMDEQGLRQVDLVEKYDAYCKRNNITNLKLTRSHLSMYLSGKFEPSSPRIAILAKLLNVSEAWLIGYDVPKGTPSLDRNSSAYIDSVVDKQLQEIENQYGQLSDKNKMKLSVYIQALIDSQEDDK